MNSKIATLLSENIKNKQIVADMIMFICNKYIDVEDHLIDLCLDTNAEYVTKEMVMKHIDKIKPLCMQYMERIEDVDNIKVISVDNIAYQAIVHFTAKVPHGLKTKRTLIKEIIGKLILRKRENIRLKEHIQSLLILKYDLKI